MTRPLWPTCNNCGRSITVHYLRGSSAYCALEYRVRDPKPHYVKGNLSTFTVAEVNQLVRALGHQPSAKAVELETKQHRRHLEVVK